MERTFQQNNSTTCMEVDGEIVVIDPSDSRMYWLNPVASRIWTLAGGPTSPEAVATGLCREFDVDYASALVDVRKMVNAFLERGLFSDGTTEH